MKQALDGEALGVEDSLIRVHGNPLAAIDRQRERRRSWLRPQPRLVREEAGPIDEMWPVVREEFRERIKQEADRSEQGGELEASLSGLDRELQKPGS